MLNLFVLLASFSLFIAPATAAAPVKARIPSGIGIVLLNPGSAEKPVLLKIYKEPSLGRISEIAPDRLPSLARSIVSSAETVPAIVTSRKAGWYRIVYEDGEREGWIKGLPSYQFYRWQELFRNRPVTLLGGLRKEFYLLRKSPDSSAESIMPIEKGVSVIALTVEGDWIRAIAGSRTEGWLRWRDENSRLVIAINL